MPERDLAITLAGGGNRAFYQLGLLNRWGDRLFPRVAAVAAVSAGACVVTFLLAGRTEEAAEFWRERRKHVTKNFDAAQLLRGRNPAPHGPIYRDTLLHAFSGGGFERIRSQPFPIYVLAAGFPRFVAPPLAAAVGIAAYQAEKAVRKEMIHPALGRRLGFEPVVVDARECETPEELAALILASSSTPPFTPVGRFRGRALLDGGLVDNVPAFVADAAPGVRRNLVLLTRPYPASVTGRRGARLYVGPTAALPVSRWDYTQPHLLDETVATGEREADTHGPSLEAFLADVRSAVI